MDKQEQLETLIHVFSGERMARYIAYAEHDPARAVTLYEYNLALSEVLYTPLQTLEVTIRNAFHQLFTEHYGERWYEDDRLILNASQRAKLEKAINDLRHERKPIEGARLIAALNFGFWTGMFGKDYENLWQQKLHHIALPNEAEKGRTRKEFAAPLHSIRVLRNRIAHHEAIIGWDVYKHYHNTMNIIGWINHDALAWCRKVSRFELVYNPDNHINTKESKV